jgi:hypothetical protein
LVVRVLEERLYLRELRCVLDRAEFGLGVGAVADLDGARVVDEGVADGVVNVLVNVDPLGRVAELGVVASARPSSGRTAA